MGCAVIAAVVVVALVFGLALLVLEGARQEYPVGE
jgi:hypothetical protein